MCCVISERYCWLPTSSLKQIQLRLLWRSHRNGHEMPHSLTQIELLLPRMSYCMVWEACGRSTRRSPTNAVPGLVPGRGASVSTGFDHTRARAAWQGPLPTRQPWCADRNAHCQSRRIVSDSLQGHIGFGCFKTAEVSSMETSGSAQQLTGRE